MLFPVLVLLHKSAIYYSKSQVGYDSCKQYASVIRTGCVWFAVFIRFCLHGKRMEPAYTSHGDPNPTRSQDSRIKSFLVWTGQQARVNLGILQSISVLHILSGRTMQLMTHFTGYSRMDQPLYSSRSLLRCWKHIKTVTLKENVRTLKSVKSSLLLLSFQSVRTFIRALCQTEWQASIWPHSISVWLQNICVHTH